MLRFLKKVKLYTKVGPETAHKPPISIHIKTHLWSLVDYMVGAEGTKIFYFDNPRSLEKELLRTELHRKLLLLTKKYKKY